MNNRQKIERASLLASRVAGDLNLAMARGKINGAMAQSCVARLEEAMLNLKSLEVKPHAD